MNRFLSVLTNTTSLLSLTCVSVTLVSCASNDTLRVRQFNLRSIEVADYEQAMVRGEQMNRLRGAVSIEEQRKRLGQYYTVSWQNTGNHPGPLKIVMEYQQAATGSKILKMSRDLPANEISGVAEFAVNGDAYLKGGRILAWRISMLSGNKVVAEKHSYLWK